jgi:hypothetical protein
MSLSEIVSRVVAETQDASGSIVTRTAVEIGKPLVRGDDEAVDQCISEALAIRIKAVAQREGKKSEKLDPKQPELFGLRPRHALDIEGRVLKATHALNRIEFERIRQIRRSGSGHAGSRSARPGAEATAVSAATASPSIATERLPSIAWSRSSSS